MHRDGYYFIFTFNILTEINRFFERMLAAFTLLINKTSTEQEDQACISYLKAFDY
jgi:hypothetical protein